MNKFYILFIAMFVVASSCQKSQFSTTTRHIKNGKVTYVNSYQTERTKSSKVKVRKSNLKETEAQNNLPALTRIGVQNIPAPEITKINPVPEQDNENLIASTSNEPTIFFINENRKHINVISFPDTIRSEVSNKGAIIDNSIEQVIKFKSGKQKTVNIISLLHDTLYYKLTHESNIVRGVLMEKVDTIIQVKKYDSAKGKVVDTRKNEPFGMIAFISSILGLVPVFGIFFAVIAVIFGGRSLGRLHRYPSRYKGTKIAKASIIIGVIGLIIGFIFIIVLIASAFHSCNDSVHF